VTLAQTYEALSVPTAVIADYALFNVVRGTLADKGVPFHENADDHHDLIADLAKVGRRDAALIGQALHDLWLQRNSADWQDKACCPCEDK